MKKKIIYLGFYDISSSEGKRYTAESAISKIDYISDCLIRNNFIVNIVSPSWYLRSNYFFKIKGQTNINLKKDLVLTKSPSIQSKFFFSLIINQLISSIWLLMWLIHNTQKNETILVYHSTFYAYALKIIKIFRKIKIVLEVEELYSEVWGVSKYATKRETVLLEISDFFIVVSKELAKRLGERSKIVVYGNYSTINRTLTNSQLENTINYSNNKQIINVIYAGSFDLTRGGAKNSVLVSGLLPDNYRVHICGKGTKIETENLLYNIEQINIKKGHEACVYHGFKTGEDYLNIIRKCDIAINPQKMGEYMSTAFPSKIVFYLSNNLRVVSTNIESIKESPFAPYIEFSKDESIDSFAEAILRVNLSKSSDISQLFKKLDQEVCNNIISIF